IDQAEIIDDINLAGYRLHQLQGGRSDTWSVTVSGNWRITFEFRNGDAYILNYEDYH
ncbi:type II toxin-antitoxin system RelE/ParE family toxin, partial [Escherichia coli]